MKIIEKIALGVCALALCGGVFFSCSNAASSGSGLTGGTGSTDSAGTGTGNGTGSGAATIQYTEVWSGSKTIDWDANGLTMDHALFTADFDALRVTFNASEGGFKMAACEPWTVITLTDTSISSGSIGADGTFYLPTGDAQTVTIKLSAADVALIKGQEHDGAWGGLKIFGADTVTITKVESFKQSSSGTEQTQTTNGGEQTQNGGQTQTQSGGEQAQTQTPAYTEVWTGTQTIDWGENAVSIDHAKFTADFDALRITYNATAGAIKLAASDKWTNITLTAASISSGSIADDGAFNLPTGDNQTVTIKLSAEDVAKIKGYGNAAEGWGGLTIQGGPTTITLTKVESFKQ